MSALSKVCEKLGKANLPVYTVVAVALFKGILRPTFTMMDKKQEPQTKKYAAIREGSTELIAIPTYIGMSWLSQKLAPAFSPKGKNFDQILANSKATLGFLGVCVAALYAIPKLCNVAMPLIMKAFKSSDEHNKKSQPIQNINLAQNQTRFQPYQNTISPNSPFMNVTSMRGGLKI